MRYAAFYGRYSCERQNEQSVEGQLRICEKYAEDNGLKIVESYIDRATTGTNDNRPAFQKMLSDCEKGGRLSDDCQSQKPGIQYGKRIY